MWAGMNARGAACYFCDDNLCGCLFVPLFYSRIALPLLPCFPLSASLTLPDSTNQGGKTPPLPTDHRSGRENPASTDRSPITDHHFQLTPHPSAIPLPLTAKSLLFYPLARKRRAIPATPKIIFASHAASIAGSTPACPMDLPIPMDSQ